jgi:YD repeat-containing protein
MKTKLLSRFSRILASLASIWLLSTAIGYTGNVSYTYDPAGRLTKAVFAADKAIIYTYNSAGNLLQRSIGPDQETDSNGDGIPDSWYLQYGLDPHDPDIANIDSDDDGFTNQEEFLLGTDPTDPDSTFKVLPNPAADGGGVTVQWLSVVGKTYRLQFRNSLAEESDWTSIPGDIVALGPVTSRIDGAATGQNTRFYRVLLVP